MNTPTNHIINPTIPWVEKYRPSKFNDIVFDNINSKLFKNILNNNYFPNLLFYGPPGTGKTTTIINLINEHQQKYNKINKSNIIHLNASDERGIDIIRVQINQFVKSMNLFETGLKFVILDEVDYMTKTAQQALKHLLQTSINNVRFCLICNYISKIDDSLKNEFILVRFNQLPKAQIYSFLKNILISENIKIKDENIDIIQQIYNSDIRSMINFIQLNQNLEIDEWDNCIINTQIFKTIHTNIIDPDFLIDDMIQYIHKLSIQFNIDKKTVLNHYFNYIIRTFHFTTPQFMQLLNIIQNLLHNDCNNTYIINYFCIFLKQFYSDNPTIA